MDMCTLNFSFLPFLSIELERNPIFLPIVETRGFQIGVSDEKDRDRVALLLALKDLADAQGGIAKLAEKTKLSRQSLYKSLSEKGNPKLETLETILNGLGFRLSVVPLNLGREKKEKAKTLEKSSSK
jgi:probable addiction module antidote protein